MQTSRRHLDLREVTGRIKIEQYDTTLEFAFVKRQPICLDVEGRHGHCGHPRAHATAVVQGGLLLIGDLRPFDHASWVAPEPRSDHDIGGEGDIWAREVPAAH